MSRRTRALASLAFLALAAIGAPAEVTAGGGCHGDQGSLYTEGDGTTVIRMDVCSFAPTVSRVPVGASVRFLNTSTIEHAVVGRSTTWASAVLSPGDEYGETFEAAGTYPFSCPLHPGMVGAIVVGDAAGAGPAGAAGAGPAGAAGATGVASGVASVAQPGPEPMSIAIVGVGGLATGLGLALGIAFVRRRTTA